MNKEKLGALILESERQLYATAKTILWQEADVEDAVQEAIVKAFAGIHTLKKDKYAKTWLIRILINECYSQLRKSRNIISLDQSEETENLQAPAAKDYSDLKKTLSMLSDELRIPVILYYINGFSVREVSEIMEISEGAVQKRLARARGKLRQSLDQEEAIS
ncbi:MAG: sigma-70 family RNA polymerase sigma factor [Firmicutes bacterium]|nr:sigma-70 family RNA polymerase sigma factor [Bacillota bacterium]